VRCLRGARAALRLCAVGPSCLHPPAQLCPILTETQGQGVPGPPLLQEGLQGLGTAQQAGLLQTPCLTLVKSSRLDGRALLRDFIGNLPPQRLLKQKLQSLTDIVNTKIFQSYGEQGTGVLAALPVLSSPGRAMA